MSGARITTRLFVALALAIAIGLASAASPLASGSPDGLERVADDKGFLGEGRLAGVQEGAPIRAYAFPGVEDERLATGLAGFVGALGVMGMGYGLAAALRRRGRAPARGAAA